MSPVTGTPVSEASSLTTLQGLRTQFIKRSGKFHLIGTKVEGSDTVPNYADDNGADIFINGAVEWLDEECRIRRRKDAAIASGEYEVTLSSRLISIDYVDLSDEDAPLKATTEDWLKAEYGYDFSLVDSDTPAYWALQSNVNTDTTGVKLWIMPPSDGSRNVQVHGKYYEAELTDNTDSNWWTLNHGKKVLYVALLLADDVHLNPDTNNTLRQLVLQATRAVISQEVANEIAVQGSVMKG